MNLRAVVLSSIRALSIGATLFGQQPHEQAGQSSDELQKYDNSQAAEPWFGEAQKTGTSARANDLKGSSLKLFGSWRFRAEAWDWFQPTAGENSYAFAHSPLRAGVSQTKERFEWLVEGAQDAIVGLPGSAIAPGNQGQLGLGGTYFVANLDRQNIASGFLKQGYLGIDLPLDGKLTVGRFGFSDGTEVKPADATLAELVNTRVAQRLIGEFNFSAVMRIFDGIRLRFDEGKNNFTFVAVRPTEGAFQVDAMGELRVNLFYGAYTEPTAYRSGAGELRIFAVGYVDQRGGVVKTDNRPLSIRAADMRQVRIGTYGADYVQVFHTPEHGQFDFLLGSLAERQLGIAGAALRGFCR